jgi:hypothetical protein
MVETTTATPFQYGSPSDTQLLCEVCGDDSPEILVGLPRNGNLGRLLDVRIRHITKKVHKVTVFMKPGATAPDF